MMLPPPHRVTSGPGSRPSGAAAGATDSGPSPRDVVAEVVRVTLLDDAARRDRREDLAGQAHARRLGFLAQAVAEITPPEPVPTSRRDPQASLGAARYRAAAAVDGGRARDPIAGPFRTDLSV